MRTALVHAVLFAGLGLGAVSARTSANYDNLGFQMTMERGCGEPMTPSQGKTVSIGTVIAATGIPLVVFETWEGESASLLIRFVVNADGKVVDAKTTKTDENGTRYAQGLADTIRTWTLGPGDQGVHCIDVSIGNSEDSAAAKAAPIQTLGSPSVATALPYPEAAKAQNITGSVELSVWITNLGTVRRVSLLGETPPGYGFADAATKAITGSWRYKDITPGWYRLKVNFAK